MIAVILSFSLFFVVKCNFKWLVYLWVTVTFIMFYISEIEAEIFIELSEFVSEY
jgi:hypothetical protein